MKLRHATAEDLRQYFGGVIPATMRAVVIEDDGKLLGVAGVARMDSGFQAFSRIADELRPHKLLMARAAAALRQMVLDTRAPVWALCSANEPTAPRLLEWCGFQHVAEGVWRHG